MVLVTTFLINLLCAISPCSYNQHPPSARISKRYYTRQTIDGKLKLENEYPIVITKYGAIQGYSMGTVQERQIFAFEGIRYAEPPINENRFRSPIPAKPWKGIYNAQKHGSMCLQIHPAFIFRVVGSEDCLFLNVYTPELPHLDNSHYHFQSKKKLPVIIFIHGGSFLFGEAAGEIGPAYIMDKNLILITINYRLGVLGFMSTGDDASPGNYGLKDQVLAIKWVNENIEQFGGDPNQVTLMGQSAGGDSVHLHLLSTKSREYFQAGISLSSSAFVHWGLYTPKEGRKWTNRLAKIANCPIYNSYQLVDCLRRKDPAFIVAHQRKIFNWLVLPPVLFAPTIEPKSPTAFISSTAQELYDRDEVAKYPWICTITSEEGYLVIYFLQIFQQLGTFRRHFIEYLPVVLNYEHLFKSTSIIDKKIQEFYIGNESTLTVSNEKLAQMATDRYFTTGIIKAIQTHSQIAPTYSYIFSYQGKYNYGRTNFGLSGDHLGISHSEDLYYIFNSSRFYEGFQMNDDEYKMSQNMINFISNFATHREPLFTNEEGVDLKIWKPVTPNDVKFLQIGNGNDKNGEWRMVENPFIERTQFWESLNLTDTTPFKPMSNFI